MNFSTMRLVFCVLCAMGMVAIGVGLVFEYGRLRRGASALSARQMRWRFFGGALWLIVLGILGYATLVLWPALGDKRAAARYVSVVGGAMVLLVIALIITGFDAYLTLATAKLQRQKFERDAGRVAREEIERIQNQQRDERD